LRGRLARASLYSLGAGLLLLNGAGVYLQILQAFDGVVLIVLAEGALYLAAGYCIGRAGSDRRLLPFILIVAILLRLGPLLLPPFLSSDIYRYVWDGRVQGAGINPYRYIPSDDALAGLRDHDIYAHINRAGYARTIYPPAAQMIFFAATRFRDGVGAMKLAMVGFDCATIALILFLLRRGGAPPERVLIYAWHPLTIWEIAGSGHVDAALVLLVTLAFAARRRNMPVFTGVALGVGALVKFFPLLLAPVLYRRWDWRLPAALGGTIVALYLPYLSVGWKVLGFLPNYIAEERLDSGAGFYLLNLLAKLSGRIDLPAIFYIAVVVAVLILLALILTFRSWRSEESYLIGSLVLASAFMILVTPHYPWYFLWLVPMLCFVPYMPMLFLTSASFVLYFALESRSPAMELMVNSLLYGSFLIAVIIHLCLPRLRAWISAFQPG
jgi:alpha-1,6-mannosyltransferase